MDIGFIGLGNMGFPMMRRLVDAGHAVVVFDARPDVVASAVAVGAAQGASVRDVADRAETVLASLPSLQASLDVATGVDGVVAGSRVRRFVDLSTVGRDVAQRIHGTLADAGIAALDSPVSGGVAGAQNGTLAVMVSGARTEFDTVKPALEAIGRPILVSEKPGAAQTMKLVNNLLAATALAATAEAMVMGVKAGLDAQVMIDVLNAGSGGTHASRDKFPRAVLPRTFDYGFATGLMVKDVRLYLEEAHSLGLPTQVADAVAALWESTMDTQGPGSDFTSIVKPLEEAAGVVIDGRTP
ncbi:MULTISPECIES: NAD(P)-dependent oxidoreductase [unclassified Mycolicibacterium]|uniref:NAD(P)-dependent oxidoreductase n=2 Tax=unclassified Mycolicibacterium TaxID=2636767 RepID=UPI001F4C338D|nr:NAD(P)-dependent oxidoreductase [Mycolicibacterium sp. YH-1]UNB53170.1 NAD(P)-dependent oxidoreductase [Mycolicibacterium sp. YH-1]